jgi:Ran GTPase-activating protein (RanGAP) involved in mRNA processing and transport
MDLVFCPFQVVDAIFRALSSILPSSDSIFQLDLSDCLLTSEGLQVIIEVRSRIELK